MSTKPIEKTPEEIKIEENGKNTQFPSIHDLCLIK